MASYDSDAFFTDAFFSDAFDFVSASASVASDGGDFFPPRDNDPRWVAFFIAQGVSRSDHGINHDARLALTRAIGLPDSASVLMSIDDAWIKWKTANGVSGIGSKDAFPPS